MHVSAEITLHDGTRVRLVERSNGVTRKYAILFQRCTDARDEEIEIELNDDDAKQFQRALSFIGVIE